MVFHRVLCFLLISLIVVSSDALVFDVGGNDGWTLRPFESHDHWAGRLRFLINDTLRFRYDPAVDSVLAVSQSDYDGCNTGSPIKKFDDGNSFFTFDRSGPFYFISGNRSNCNQGEKLVVVVLAPRNPSLPASPPPVAQPPVTPPFPTPIPPSPSTADQAPGVPPAGSGAPPPYTADQAPGVSPAGSGAPPPSTADQAPGVASTGSGTPPPSTADQAPGVTSAGSGAPPPPSPSSASATYVGSPTVVSLVVVSLTLAGLCSVRK